MKLTQYQQSVYSGLQCPYCKSETKVVSEKYIYGRSYKDRSMICCVNFPTCRSYVGTHEEDGSSLGRLANKTLRQFKNRAHEHFDKIWMEDYHTRSETYELLSEYLEIPVDYTHIGFFNEETCKKVIDWSIKTYKDLKN
ncbi:zinc-finger-containing domain protein [Tenacibaculum phage Gundel_1]|uniref:Zinc-finger-containing domain protein n=1 Tax=Tenacibaculum phage Gundel_1 TaxID=2745672 RepID=A0A8E4ZM70_9CAUD|nr:zinc-finger-containing domain protein [Tenacibaculum phage Gundel_1]QQV91459.1 zinc-finger-containing domain protein [Tenacibaculum phage Gundel_1]